MTYDFDDVNPFTPMDGSVQEVFLHRVHLGETAESLTPSGDALLGLLVLHYIPIRRKGILASERPNKRKISLLLRRGAATQLHQKLSELLGHHS